MTAGSGQIQKITGTSTVTFNLPDATYLISGSTFLFNNNSTGSVTVNDHGGTLVETVPAGGYAELVCTDNSTTNGQWDYHNFWAFGTVSGTAGTTMVGYLTVPGQITSQVTTGTAPFVVSSTTQVANLNAATAGTAGTATNATNVATTQVSNNASYYPLMVASSTNGNQACDLGTGLTYNPSTNILSTTGLNLSGLTASYAVVTDASKNLSTVAALGIGNGGTGQTTALAAINALTVQNTSSVIIGTSASTNSGVTQSVVIGDAAGANLTGSHNTFVGYQAGNDVTSGSDNTFVGYNAGLVQGGALTGGQNTGIGSGALNGIASSGANNTAVGYNAMPSVTSATYCTSIGRQAGSTFNTGSYHTCLGYNTAVSSNGLSNSTAIGYNTAVNASNAMVLGNGVNVGIDSSFSTAPTARLSLPGGTTSASSAPLKMHSGSVMTSAEAGAIENDGTYLYYTTDTPTRQRITAGLGTILPKNYVTNNDFEVDISGWTTYADTQTVTITIATPGVFTVTSTTNIFNGMPVAFTTTGALPTGLTAGTTYYVTNVNVDGANKFRVSTSRGGSDLATSGSQSGTHTFRPLVPVTTASNSLSGLTFARSTSSPLDTTASALFTQTNSTDVAGQGVYYGFTIDSSQQAHALSVQFDFNASSTFSTADGITAPNNGGSGDSDIEVFIYDVTNAAVIYASPQVITANGANNFTFKATFQSASNSTSYRLVLHTAKTSANATGYTFKFDNVYVGPQTILQGPPVTDWTAYTPTFGGVGTATAISAWYKRVGDNLQVQGIFSTGTTAASTFTLSLPSGLAIDTTKLQANYANVGDIIQLYTGTSTAIPVSGSGPWLLTYDGSTTGNVFLSAHVGTSALIKENGNYLNSTTAHSFKFTVPIAGWSSTTLMSNDTDTRVVAASYYASSATFTPGSNTQINFDTKLYDTHAAVTTGAGAWKFTAPVSGYYQINALVDYGSGTSGNIELYKNGSAYAYLGYYASGTYFGGSNTLTLQLNAGDYIDVRPTTGATFDGGGAPYATIISINRVSGPSAIAAADPVAASYYTLSSSTITSGTALIFNTKSFDTHGAYNTSTGQYTCPIAGYYQVGANVYTCTSSSAQLSVYKNGSAINGGGYNAAIGQMNTTTGTGGSLIVQCNAGDIITIVPQASVTAGSVGANFSIARTGRGN